RGVRLDQALGGRGALDKASNIALQNDVKNCRAERSCPHILRHLGDAEPAFVRLLGDWDYRYALNAVAPTVFEAFMALWQREVISQHMPERLLDLTHQQTGLAATLLEDSSITYFADGIASHVITTARRTLAALRERLGADTARWQWGRVHQAHWHHPVGDA